MYTVNDLTNISSELIFKNIIIIVIEYNYVNFMVENQNIIYHIWLKP